MDDGVELVVESHLFGARAANAELLISVLTVRNGGSVQLLTSASAVSPFRTNSVHVAVEAGGALELVLGDDAENVLDRFVLRLATAGSRSTAAFVWAGSRACDCWPTAL